MVGNWGEDLRKQVCWWGRWGVGKGVDAWDHFPLAGSLQDD